MKMGDLLAAISVLLVFLTFLLNGLQEEVDNQLKVEKPPVDQDSSLKEFNAGIRKLLWLKAVPVSIIFSLIFYVLLPKTVDIILSSHLNIWRFDELSTIWVFIDAGLFGMAAFAIIKVIQLVRKNRE